MLVHYMYDIVILGGYSGVVYLILDARIYMMESAVQFLCPSRLNKLLLVSLIFVHYMI